MVSNIKPEIIEPKKDSIDMIKTILKQHDEIIRINSDLCKTLSMPIFFLKKDSEIIE